MILTHARSIFYLFPGFVFFSINKQFKMKKELFLLKIFDNILENRIFDVVVLESNRRG